MELGDARCRDGLLDCIDQPDVTARTDDDQPTALDDIASGMLVWMHVLEKLAAALSLCEMIVLVHHRASAYLLEGISLDCSYHSMPPRTSNQKCSIECRP